MRSQAVIDYLNKSLRMKICKGLIKQISEQEVSLTYINDSVISISVKFPSKLLNLLDLNLDIPEEGSIRMPRKELSLVNSECIIDILIVDDVEFNISVLKKLLEGLEFNCDCSNSHRKYTIHTAGSGKEALESVSRQNSLTGGYRLIIRDC